MLISTPYLYLKFSHEALDFIIYVIKMFSLTLESYYFIQNSLHANLFQ